MKEENRIKVAKYIEESIQCELKEDKTTFYVNVDDLLDYVFKEIYFSEEKESIISIVYNSIESFRHKHRDIDIQLRYSLMSL